MESRGIWSEDQEAKLIQRCKEEIEQEVRHYLDSEPPRPESMFDSLYAELPGELDAQRRSLLGKEAHDE